MKFKIFQKLGRWVVVDSKSELTCHTTLTGAMDYACSQDRKADQFGTSTSGDSHSNNS